MKYIVVLLFLCAGCTNKFKPIVLTELDNQINICDTASAYTVDTTLYLNNAKPVISLQLYNNDTLNFISTDDCSYKYIRFIEVLNIYELKYEDYHSEGIVLVSKFNGENYRFEGEIIFNDRKTHFITYNQRQNDMPSQVQLYSVNLPLDIQLLYTYKTLLQDPIDVFFRDNKTAVVCLRYDSIIKQYLLEF